jgi:hypothetical protein
MCTIPRILIGLRQSAFGRRCHPFVGVERQFDTQRLSARPST